MTTRKSRGRTAPRALPSSQPPVPVASGVLDIIRALLPERTADDILGERLRLRLGEVIVTLPVLPIEANEGWVALLNARFADIMGDLEKQADPAGVLTFLSGMTATQLELLRAYDRDAQLPPDAWIRANATATQLVKALLACMAAAFPLADLTFRAVLESPDLQAAMRTGWSMFTSSQQPSGASEPPVASAAS